MKTNSSTKGLRIMQCVLILIGTLNSFFTLYHSITHHLSVGFIVVSISEVIAFIGIIIYAAFFYKKSIRVFRGLIFMISFVVMMVGITISDFFVVSIFYYMTYGLILVFGVKLDERKYASTVIALAIILSICGATVASLSKKNEMIPAPEMPAAMEEMPLSEDAPAEAIPMEKPSAAPIPGGVFMEVAKYATTFSIPLILGTLALSFHIQGKKE